jgi:hypothetical protein
MHFGMPEVRSLICWAIARAASPFGSKEPRYRASGLLALTRARRRRVVDYRDYFLISSPDARVKPKSATPPTPPRAPICLPEWHSTQRVPIRGCLRRLGS